MTTRPPSIRHLPIRTRTTAHMVRSVETRIAAFDALVACRAVESFRTGNTHGSVGIRLRPGHAVNRAEPRHSRPSPPRVRHNRRRRVTRSTWASTAVIMVGSRSSPCTCRLWPSVPRSAVRMRRASASTGSSLALTAAGRQMLTSKSRVATKSPSQRRHHHHHHHRRLRC